MVGMTKSSRKQRKIKLRQKLIIRGVGGHMKNQKRGKLTNKFGKKCFRRGEGGQMR